MLKNSAHLIHWFRSPLWNVYTYNRASDGPECEIITRILARHPYFQLGAEARSVRQQSVLDMATRIIFGFAPKINSPIYSELTTKNRMFVLNEVARRIARLGL